MAEFLSAVIPSPGMQVGKQSGFFQVGTGQGGRAENGTIGGPVHGACAATMPSARGKGVLKHSRLFE
jgi:hypothetical protein